MIPSIVLTPPPPFYINKCYGYEYPTGVTASNGKLCVFYE